MRAAMGSRRVDPLETHERVADLLDREGKGQT